MTIYAQYDKIVVLDLVVVFYIAYLDDRTTTKNNVPTTTTTFKIEDVELQHYKLAPSDSSSFETTQEP